MWPYLGHIVYVKAILVSISEWHDLNEPVPGGGASIKETFVQVSGGKVLISLTFFGSFLIREVFDALSSFEMVFNQEWFALCVDPLEGVRTVSVHVSEAIRSTSVGEQDHDLMLGLWCETPEVKSSVWILDSSLGMSLLGMNKVWELHGIFDEEDWSIVSDHVIITFLGEELD